MSVFLVWSLLLFYFSFKFILFQDLQVREDRMEQLGRLVRRITSDACTRKLFSFDYVIHNLFLFKCFFEALETEMPSFKSYHYCHKLMLFLYSHYSHVFVHTFQQAYYCVFCRKCIKWHLYDSVGTGRCSFEGRKLLSIYFPWTFLKFVCIA